MFSFPYLPERIRGISPPTLSTGTRFHWRPLIPVKVRSTSGVVLFYHRALLDSGSQDTLLPLGAARTAGIPLLPDVGHIVRWRGAAFPLRFGRVEFQMEDCGVTWRWSAVVAFADLSVPYPILGLAGFLEYFDATFRGEDRVVELAPNGSFTGDVEPLS